MDGSGFDFWIRGITYDATVGSGHHPHIVLVKSLGPLQDAPIRENDNDIGVEVAHHRIHIALGVSIFEGCAQVVQTGRGLIGGWRD